MRTPSLGARAFIPAALIGAVLLSLAPGATGTAAAADPRSEAEQIIAVAKQQLGDPWRRGANGPTAFDCSGLVIYAYRKAGDGAAIRNGKGIRSARAMYVYFKRKGMTSRSNPKPGDIVVWGGGTHVGLYIGNGKAISTLTSGVRVHGVRAVTAKFTTYIHMGMSARPVAGTAKAASTKPKSKSTATAKAAAKIRHTDGTVNLRTGAGTRHRVITALRNDTRLEVLASKKDARGRTWIKVDAGRHTGWLARWLTD